MRNLIILLTYKYPYEPPCEQFLDEEIKYYLNDDLCFVPCCWGVSQKEKHKNFDSTSLKTVIFSRKKSLKFYMKAMASFLKAIFLYKKDKKRSDIFSGKSSFKSYFKSVLISKLIAYEISKEYDLSKYEKVMIYSYWLNSNAIVAYLLKEFYSKRNISICAVSRAHGQGDLFLDDFSRHVNRPGIFAYKSLNKIYTISECGFNFLKEEGFQNIEVSRLGTLDGVYSNKESSSTSFHIVSCSTVNKNKNVLEIAKQISKTTFSIKWTHFGDGPEFEELKRFCESCGNKNFAFELKGNTRNEVIKSFYRLSSPDLFVNLSTIEGIPVSIMEAMSFGIPCIATNVGATSEIVINGFNGFLIELDQIENLYNKIVSYYSMTPEEKNVYRLNAFNFWEKNYKASTNYENFAKKLNCLNYE